AHSARPTRTAPVATSHGSTREIWQVPPGRPPATRTVLPHPNSCAVENWQCSILRAAPVAYATAIDRESDTRFPFSSEPLSALQTVDPASSLQCTAVAAVGEPTRKSFPRPERRVGQTARLQRSARELRWSLV